MVLFRLQVRHTTSTSLDEADTEMTGRNFYSGMGMGLVAGSAIGMLISPRTRNSKDCGKSTVGRCLRSLGSVVDGFSDMLR